jgi:hypothetical protein
MNQERVGRRRRGAPEFAVLEAVFAAIAVEAARLGIELPLTRPEAATRSRRVDPVSGDETVVCAWCDDWGRPAGGLVMNPDGSFYAEQAVGRPFSLDPARVVESIRAWGWNGCDDLHSEARLSRAG